MTQIKSFFRGCLWKFFQTLLGKKLRWRSPVHPNCGCLHLSQGCRRVSVRINRRHFLPVLTAGLQASEHLRFFFVSLPVLTASLQSSAHLVFLVSLPVLTASLQSSAHLVFLVSLPVLTASLQSSAHLVFLVNLPVLTASLQSSAHLFFFLVSLLVLTESRIIGDFSLVPCQWLPCEGVASWPRGWCSGADTTCSAPAPPTPAAPPPCTWTTLSRWRTTATRWRTPAARCSPLCSPRLRGPCRSDETR